MIIDLKDVCFAFVLFKAYCPSWLIAPYANNRSVKRTKAILSHLFRWFRVELAISAPDPSSIVWVFCFSIPQLGDSIDVIVLKFTNPLSLARLSLLLIQANRWALLTQLWWYFICFWWMAWMIHCPDDSNCLSSVTIPRPCWFPFKGGRWPCSL